MKLEKRLHSFLTKSSSVQISIILPTIIFVILGILLLWQVMHQISTGKRVAHSHQVITQAHVIENRVVDMETGVRGYALTGDPDFLEPYEKALPEIEPSLKLLRELVEGDKDQEKKIAKMEAEVRQWIPYAQTVIVTRQSGLDPSNYIAAKKGKVLVDSFRFQVHSFIEKESNLLAERIDLAAKSAKITIFATIGGLLISGLMLILGLIIKKDRETRLREAEHQFRLMIDSTSDYAIYRLDSHGFIQTWNLGAERLSGFKANEVIGKHFSIFYTSEDVEKGHPQHELNLAQQHGKYEEEGWRVRKDGSRFWASVIITPLKNGPPMGFTKIIRDLTQRKLAEDAMRNSRDHLEFRVRDRTRELELAIKSREEVLAMVSHDLKNPLSAIQLNAKILMKLVEKNDALKGIHQQIERMVRASKRMEELISDILDVTKMGAGKFTIDPHFEQIGNLIRESVELFEGPAAEKRIELIVELGADCCRVSCDHSRILQVLMNLIGNAIKFTPEGGQVRIGAKQSGNESLFWVSDTGPGIRKEDQIKIFNRFWQARETSTRGTGLGLAIAKGIIDAHNGRIWVESEPSQGSTFYFTLRLANSQDVKTG